MRDYGCPCPCLISSHLSLISHLSSFISHLSSFIRSPSSGYCAMLGECDNPSQRWKDCVNNTLAVPVCSLVINSSFFTLHSPFKLHTSLILHSSIFSPTSTSRFSVLNIKARMSAVPNLNSTILSPTCKKLQSSLSVVLHATPI